jgi:hypothetical protein
VAEPEARAAAQFRAFSMPGRKPRGEWLAPEIEVGTRSTCALNLNDPVVAEHHCTLRATESGFVVLDLGSATGTWHNGIAVEGAVKLASGDQVVIGVSRLSIEIKIEGDRSVCEIVVEEASFHYKRPKPGEFHTDADEWVRSEVRFGRIPAVRGAAWLAGLLSVLGMVWIFATNSGRRFLQPGPLDGTHASLFARNPAASLGSAAADSNMAQASMTKIAHESCRVCHAGSQAGIVSNCVACHTPMATQHPFITGNEANDSRLDPKIQKPANGCRLCHEVGHSGLSRADSIAQAQVRLMAGSGGLPGSDVCVNCHVEPPGDQSRVLQRIDELANLLADSNAAARTDRHEYGFDEFSHRVHVGKRSIDCLVCHVPAPNALGDAAGTEFKTVAFANCAACHVDGMPAPEELPGFDKRTLSDLRAELAKKNLRVQMSWHGRGEHCLECHAKGDAAGAIGKELAHVDRKVAARTFGIVRMAHDQHAQAAKNTKADCGGCHADPRTLSGGKASTAEFRHGSHVETLWPATPAQRDQLSARSCSTCHADLQTSDSVAGGIAMDLGAACKDCHTDQSRPDPKQRVSEQSSDASTKSSVEFSHKLHQGKIEGGCFACHEFKGARDGDPFAKPGLLEGVDTCAKCHADHKNVEHGACNFCHPIGAAAGSGSAVLFQNKKPARLDWPAGFHFDHFSGTESRGHRAYIGLSGASGVSGCSKCHDLENLKQADVVIDLAIPGARGSLRLCIDCHVNERGWFHWTLPDPKSK